jgi:hypothetical protein
VALTMKWFMQSGDGNMATELVCCCGAEGPGRCHILVTQAAGAVRIARAARDSPGGPSRGPFTDGRSRSPAQGPPQTPQAHWAGLICQAPAQPPHAGRARCPHGPTGDSITPGVPLPRRATASRCGVPDDATRPGPHPGLPFNKPQMLPVRIYLQAEPARRHINHPAEYSTLR